MDVPRSTVSQHVQKLERELGARLIKRNTRFMSLTQMGRTLYRDADANLDSLDRAFRQIEQGGADFVGKITVSAPADFDPSPISQAIKSVLQAHPGVEFEIRLTNDVLNLIEENIDVAIGVASRTDGGRVEKEVIAVEWRLCASAAYLKAHKVSDALDQLGDFIAPQTSLRRLLERELLGGRTLPAGMITCDNLAMAKALILDDVGVGLVPRGMVREELDRGHVRPLFESEISGTTQLVMVFPSRQDIQPHVRAFHKAFIAAMT